MPKKPTVPVAPAEEPILIPVTEEVSQSDTPQEAVTFDPVELVAPHVEPVAPHVEPVAPHVEPVVLLEDAPVGHASASEGKVYDVPPSAPALGEIPELGISPVAMLSKTWASDLGPGGAAHAYKTLMYSPDGAIAASSEVRFHKGALSTVGGIPNGIADATLLSILAHRWEGFLADDSASEGTAETLEHIKAAISCINAGVKA
jgi:hypothetical protein